MDKQQPRSGTTTSAGTAQTAEREFDIGDVVSLKTEDVLATVTGVIHDSGRLFITAPGDSKEREVPFSEVGEQYVLKSAAEAQQLREQRDELMAALRELLAANDEPAGMSMSMVANRAEFQAFLLKCEARVDAAKDAARDAIARVEAAK